MSENKKEEISEAAQAIIDDHLAEIADLKKQNKDLSDLAEELNSINTTLTEKVEELENNISTVAENHPAKKTSIPDKSFKVGKEEYVFTVPRFTNPLGDGNITAEEALTNKELCEYLVKNDCGVTKRKGS